jgi:hypothetical protein
MKAHNISGPAGLEAVWLQKILPGLNEAGKAPVVWQVRSDTIIHDIHQFATARTHDDCTSIMIVHLYRDNVATLQEILDNLSAIGLAGTLPSNTIIESWKGGSELLDVAKRGYNTIFTLFPDWYLDHSANPGPGGVVTLWNDWSGTSVCLVLERNFICSNTT